MHLLNYYSVLTMPTIQVQQLHLINSFVEAKRARAFYIPESGSLVYEPLTGYTFEMGCWYYGIEATSIELTASGTLLFHDINDNVHYFDEYFDMPELELAIYCEYDFFYDFPVKPLLYA